MTAAVLLLALSAVCFVFALVFYARGLRACQRAIATLAEARLIHEGVECLLETNLDTVARVEEFTV